MSTDNRKKSPKNKSDSVHSHDWMTPIQNGMSCGADLEYDPEFVVLAAAVAAKTEAQYGDFVGVSEPVNWTDVDRDCRRLMMRSKDIRLAVLFTRCCTRLKGAAGLAEGLALLAAWLAAWPDEIHPRPDVDDDRDAALEIRMNALQSLTDTDGLLSDLREIALARSTANRLQVRDVERAFALPRPLDALAPESVRRQLEELRMQRPSVLTGFDHALESLTAIEGWCRAHLNLYAPDLAVLKRMLCHVAVPTGSRPVHTVLDEAHHAQPESKEEPQENAALAELPTTSDDNDADMLSLAVASRTAVSAHDRHAALDLIREARQWFEQHEPSSPIPVLLKRAEQFVGKRYADVVTAIPPELLAQWEQAD